MTAIAFFITPHGFGHAARAAAVMAALHARRPAAHFHLFTTTPEWFFRESLRGPFTHHATAADIGLAQTSPLSADLVETVRRLEALLPLRADWVAGLAAQVRALGCRLVLCDVAALGIAVAQAAGLPAVLIENFTWDWIYAGYFAEAPALRAHAATFQALYAGADHHVQTAPVCAPAPRAALTTTAPVAREPRQAVLAVRRRLGLPARTKAVLLTMGGFQRRYAFLDRLRAYRGVWFVIPGGGQRWEQADNLVWLPHHSPIYHPDLVNSCDVVIGKLGYSTLAEAYQAGVPFGFIRRPGFRESDVLADYATAQMTAVEVTEADFESGDWSAFLPRLLELPRWAAGQPNGADQVAEYLLGLA
jgi:UDP:flavonoid glycosyltransferase YjiC (YdhE family)